MNIYEKLLCVQTELKAPKSQFNKFGGYNYRNCEDILEAVKPILARYKAVVLLSDELAEVKDRIYVKATALFVNVEKPEEKIIATAYAREEESKKGMDGSQVTGASSSYARKYALNGLFDIDDNKDSDTTNDHGKSNNAVSFSQPPKKPEKPKSSPPKQTTTLSEEARTELNTAIARYSKLSNIPVAKVVGEVQALAGIQMKDVKESDVEKVLDVLSTMTEEIQFMKMQAEDEGFAVND